MKITKKLEKKIERILWKLVTIDDKKRRLVLYDVGSNVDDRLKEMLEIFRDIKGK